MVNIKEILAEFETNEIINGGEGEWLLPNGDFITTNNDHRNIGHWCTNNKLKWLEFVKWGAVSIHYNQKCKFLWIRTSGLSTQQRMKFQELFDDFGLVVNELKVDYYEFDGNKYDLEVTIEKYDMAKLYLMTDTVAYNLGKQYETE